MSHSAAHAWCAEVVVACPPIECPATPTPVLQSTSPMIGSVFEVFFAQSITFSCSPYHVFQPADEIGRRPAQSVYGFIVWSSHPTLQLAGAAMT